MRERAEFHGGELRAGALPSGGYEVTAHLAPLSVVSHEYRSGIRSDNYEQSSRARLGGLARDPQFRALVASRRRFVAIGTAFYSGYLVAFLALLATRRTSWPTRSLGISLALWGGL